MIALFVLSTDELATFSKDVPDDRPETLRAVLAAEGFTPDDVHEVFVTDGDLAVKGPAYLTP